MPGCVCGAERKRWETVSFVKNTEKCTASAISFIGHDIIMNVSKHINVLIVAQNCRLSIFM